MRSKAIVTLLGAVMAWMLVGCRDASNPSGAATSTTDTNRQVFQVKGVVREVRANGKSAIITHEEIPNYMEAMTMAFDVKDPKELEGLKPGDAVSFRMIVTEDDGWIENVRKLPPAPPTNGVQTVTLPGTTTTNQVTYRRAPNVEPLNEGDVIPDYKFTNQFDQPISLSQFHGQALGITFIFTRCPFPTFCPRMLQNFQKAQAGLKAQGSSITNWSLLAISFDPEWDTPERMRKYAAPYNIDTNRWQFATSDLWNIDAITEQFGMTFYRDTPNALPNHNLRTAVIDPRGRVQKIFVGNEWSVDEFVQEMVKAAKTVK